MKKIFILIAALMLSACVTVEKEYIRVNKWHHLPLDSKNLKECEIPKPLDKKTYMSLSKDEREAALAVMVSNSNSSIRQCNIQLEALAKQDKENAAIVAKRNKEIEEKAKK